MGDLKPKTLEQAEAIHETGIPFHKAVAGDPAGYEKMERKFEGEGLSRKAAQKKAARIWNSKHKGGQTVGRGRR
jgi:hypothetical protein